MPVIVDRCHKVLDRCHKLPSYVIAGSGWLSSVGCKIVSRRVSTGCTLAFAAHPFAASCQGHGCLWADTVEQGGKVFSFFLSPASSLHCLGKEPSFSSLNLCRHGLGCVLPCKITAAPIIEKSIQNFHPIRLSTRLNMATVMWASVST